MKTFFVIFGLTLGTISLGGEFCDGFEEGFKTVKGEYAAPPACPAEPATPATSTPFREGIKAGIKAANRR